MKLRVTRPGFINGIQALAVSDATRTEMRSYVCGQRHVEYYCSSKMPLTFPWGQGLRAADQEKFWNETKFPDGERFFDYKHVETGAPILKAQHPEFELWSQGIHARSGVACATEEQLAEALELQRKAQWRLDFIAAGNSMGSMPRRRQPWCSAKPPTTRARASSLRWNQPREAVQVAAK